MTGIALSIENLPQRNPSDPCKHGKRNIKRMTIPIAVDIIIMSSSSRRNSILGPEIQKKDYFRNVIKVSKRKGLRGNILHHRKQQTI